ncbi:MAG: hypothetical protein P4L64_08975 [Caulobacteraceae bacterium]|nr:hypothetical protein [Caulobacteraceae bacterium]
MKRALLTLAAIAGLGLSLAACETATPYQPLHPGAEQSGGYTEIRIEPDRWKVTFRGNSMTSRDTVETYLLYRAAELTVNQGFDWFETVDRQTDKHTQTYAETMGAGPYGPYGYGWRPYWRYYGGGYGWRGWDPYWGDPFWADRVDIRTIEKYEASAEVIMGHGPKPAGEKRAFEAREVLSNLSSKIVKPN